MVKRLDAKEQTKSELVITEIGITGHGVRQTPLAFSASISSRL